MFECLETNLKVSFKLITMSTISTLHFTKLNDLSCRILMRLQSLHDEIGIELQDNPGEIAPTAMAFLLDLLEYNGISSDLQKRLQTDLDLDQNTDLSNYFINSETVMNYVKSVSIIKIREEGLYADTVPLLGLSKEKEDIFWDNILQKTKHHFYPPYEDDFPEDVELPRFCGNMNILENIAELETFLSPEQLDEIWPCMEFELVFHENYLKEITSLTSKESALNAQAGQWLERI